MSVEINKKCEKVEVANPPKERVATAQKRDELAQAERDKRRSEQHSLRS